MLDQQCVRKLRSKTYVVIVAVWCSDFGQLLILLRPPSVTANAHNCRVAGVQKSNEILHSGDLGAMGGG